MSILDYAHIMFYNIIINIMTCMLIFAFQTIMSHFLYSFVLSCSLINDIIILLYRNCATENLHG